MSFEKVIIIGVERLVSKKNGKVYNFLDIQILQSQRIYLNDVMIKNLSVYESLKGKECLLPVDWIEYQGKPSLNLADSGLPVILPGVSAPISQIEASSMQTEQTATAPSMQTEQTATAPLFKSRNAAST